MGIGCMAVSRSLGAEIVIGSGAVVCHVFMFDDLIIVVRDIGMNTVDASARYGMCVWSPKIMLCFSRQSFPMVRSPRVRGPLPAAGTVRETAVAMSPRSWPRSSYSACQTAAAMTCLLQCDFDLDPVGNLSSVLGRHEAPASARCACRGASKPSVTLATSKMRPSKEAVSAASGTGNGRRSPDFGAAWVAPASRRLAKQSRESSQTPRGSAALLAMRTGDVSEPACNDN